MRKITSKALRTVENLDDGQVLYLAGLLEGEAHFGWKNNSHGRIPLMRLAMIDEDVVTKAAKMLGKERVCRSHAPSQQAAGKKPVYIAEITGWAVLALMDRLEPHMGSRRRERFAEIRQAPSKPSANH